MFTQPATPNTASRQFFTHPSVSDWMRWILRVAPKPSLSSPRLVPTLTYLDKITLDELGKQSLTQGSRAALDNHTGILEGGDLGVGITLATADDGTGVTHAAAGGRADTGDEADGGLVEPVVGLEELGGVLLGAATDLTDHDDTVGLGVLEEDLQAVDEVGTGERITANTDDERLAKTGLGSLVDRLVGQGAGPGDDANTAALVDEAGHDTDLALTLLKKARQTWRGNYNMEGKGVEYP